MRVKSYQVRSYIPEKRQKGAAQLAGQGRNSRRSNQNRRPGARQLRQELCSGGAASWVERSFAHCYETGGMRRCHLRGRENHSEAGSWVHVGAFNLSLVLRKLLGAGRRESGRTAPEG